MNIKNLTVLLALLAILGPIRGEEYDSVNGFGVEQGLNNWNYYWRAPKAVQGDDSAPEEPLLQMDASSGGGWVAPAGGGRRGSLGRNFWQSGDEGTVIRAFAVPRDGQITLSARGPIQIKGGENSGARIRVMKNDQPLWPEQGWTVLRSNADPLAFSEVTIEVKQGDEILFCAKRAPESGLFNLFWRPVVAYASATGATAAPSARSERGTGGALEMCWVFDDGMVLQAEREVPVWGQTEPGVTVTVRFGDQEKTAVADGEGEWAVRLDPMPLSAEGRELRIEAPFGTKVFEDVLVGDVWIASGQSNMAQPSAMRSTGGESFEDWEGNPLLRSFNVAYNSWAAEPQTRQFPWETRVTNWFRWNSASGNTPAVPFFFGNMLQEETGGPIGLILVPLGASAAEAWVPMHVLAGDPEFAAFASQSREYMDRHEENRTAFQKKVAEWEQRKQESEARGEAFKERRPQTGMNAAFWPRWWAGALYNSHIAPLRNMAVKGVIWYQGENNAAGHGGAVNTSEGYQHLMRLLIDTWREQFEQPDLPFYQVQLSMFNWNDFNNRRKRDPNQPGSWSVIREAQEQVARDLPHSNIAITVDVGDKGNIHPPNKRPMGERLALLALRDVYGKDVIAEGPAYAGHKVEDGRIRLQFKHTHGGLAVLPREEVPDGRLVGFAIAGADRNFVWADAEIDGETVVVWSEDVPDPVAVRYAYVQYHDVNLGNGAGLPAAPFRTDNWPLQEQKEEK